MDKMELVRVLWNYLCLNGSIEKADCIVGLGCYDLDIPRHCAKLYHEGYSDIIVFSGGLGRNTLGMWDVPEAQKFAEIAIESGVPKEKIYVEDKSTNTGENIRFTNKLIEENGLNINTFILVHKPYMERRSYATFMANTKDKKCYITSPNNSFDDYFAKEHEVSKDDVINALVGDLQRIKIYGEKGWQIYQEIPEEVWKAYEDLIKLGYDKNVIIEE